MYQGNVSVNIRGTVRHIFATFLYLELFQNKKTFFFFLILRKAACFNMNTSGESRNSLKILPATAGFSNYQGLIQSPLFLLLLLREGSGVQPE